MSITPRDLAPSSRADGDEDAGEQAGRLGRFAARVRVAVVRVLAWLTTVSAPQFSRSRGADEGANGTTERGADLRRGSVARLRAGDASDDRDRDSDRSRNGPGSDPAGLPERPSLEVEETGEGLRVSSPGETEAYVVSDHWEDVER